MSSRTDSGGPTGAARPIKVIRTKRVECVGLVCHILPDSGLQGGMRSEILHTLKCCVAQGIIKGSGTPKRPQVLGLA